MKISNLRGLLHGISMVLAFAAFGCSPTPEKVGDECEPDGDPCPSGSVCTAAGEDHTCQLPPIPVGGVCDPAETPERCEGDAICGKNLDGTGKCGLGESATCDPADSKCAGGLSCAELQAGGFACYRPVLVKGNVFDSETKGGIKAAQVMALDSQASAVSDIALTDATGNYVLEVPVQREMDGKPIKDVSFTLRASAQDYQTFPGGLRTALPVSSNEAQKADDGYTIKTTITDIALIGLPDAEKGQPSISGKVLADAASGGVLVVAEDSMAKGFSAITDKSGAYTIFNVPKGAYNVNGYAAGIQLVPAMTNVEAMAVTGVDLAKSADGLGTISGSLSIVNAPGGSATSVVLVVASTFSDTFVRGEVPRGLRSPLSGPPNVTGSFSIPNVPAGKYKVLAAFENDGLVRDPDPNISGTQIVEVTMPTPGMDVPVASGFKVTEALPLVSPGADEAEAIPMGMPPTLTWGDDSSEDFYTVVVYNAYGELVWCAADPDVIMGCAQGNVPGVSGATNVTVPYGGPMDPGMYYQFRATSWRVAGGKAGAISNTEDLRGVFYVTP